MCRLPLLRPQAFRTRPQAYLGPPAALTPITGNHKEKEDVHLCIDLRCQSPGSQKQESLAISVPANFLQLPIGILAFTSGSTGNLTSHDKAYGNEV
ncbi:uncharacterized [Tachysurus ichikawai]